MKKFFTLAMMALLLGGFAINANAQESLKYKSNKKTNQTTVVVSKDIQGENIEKQLKDYEQAVEQCLTLYNSMQKGDKTAKSNSKEFQTLLTKAENLKKTLENSRKDMTRSQVNRFNNASKKLLKVYED